LTGRLRLSRENLEKTMTPDDFEVVWSGGPLLPGRPEHLGPTWIGRARTKRETQQRRGDARLAGTPLLPARIVGRPRKLRSFTEQDKAMFLDLLSRGRSIRIAAYMAKVSYQVARGWVER
jgi:hypothetical protein